MLVALESSDAVAPSPSDAAMLADIREKLKAENLLDSEMIRIVQPQKITALSVKTARGVIRLRKAKFSAAFPVRIRSLARLPKPTVCSVENGTVTIQKAPAVEPDTEVYYLDDGNPGGTPLFGRVFLPGKTAAAEIAQTIRNYALRSNLESLNNSASTLPSQLSLSVSRIAKSRYGRRSGRRSSPCRRNITPD